jgi:hypothetical protein
MVEEHDILEKYLSMEERRAYPDGSFDEQGRWFASEAELRDCCKDFIPSRTKKFKQLNHCRSLLHLSNYFNIDLYELRGFVYAYKQSIRKMTGQ